jgi:hypothetical protein
MITLSEIEAGDQVSLVEQRGNTASGTVLLDATRGRLCVRAFGVLVPFAVETSTGGWALTPGVQVVAHTGSLLRVAVPPRRCPELFARRSATTSGDES